MKELDSLLKDRGLGFLKEQAFYAYIAIASGMVSIGVLLIINNVDMGLVWLGAILFQQTISFVLRYYNEVIFITKTKRLRFGLTINVFDAAIICSCLLFVPVVSKEIAIFMMAVLLIICLGSPLTSATYRPLLWSFASPLLLIQLCFWSYYYYVFSHEIFLLAMFITAIEFVLLTRFVETYRAELILTIAAQIEAERAHKSKTRFFNASAHDLRQPIVAAAAFIDSAISTDNTTDQIQFLNKTRRAINLLDERLSPIMTLAHLESGKIKLKSSKFSLNNLCKELYEIQSVNINKNTKIKIQLENELTIFTDREILSRILSNVLNNAAKFTRNGFIKIITKKTSTQIHIIIEDTGIGIKQDQLEFITDEFYQVNNEKHEINNTGYGLGLSITKRLSSLLGIDLKIESIFKKGTKVTLKIPINNNMTTS